VLFHRVVGATPREIAGGLVALLAVKPTMSSAAFAVLLGRPAVWQRTNKFRTPPARWRFLADARTEIGFGLFCLAVAATTLVVLPLGVASALLALGFAWQAVVYATAPVLAWVAERALRRPPVPVAPARVLESS
jgi:hypothetical protein